MSVAETVMLSIMKQMGVTPDQVVTLIQNISGAVLQVRDIHAEMAVLKAERAAFHQGAEYVVNDFRERLARIEALLASNPQQESDHAGRNGQIPGNGLDHGSGQGVD